MEKAYDVKALVEKLKGKGLDLAEDAAKIAAESVLEWIQESAISSETKFDDILAALIPVVKGPVLEQIDKIDGKVG